jgi:hypothetical protein
MELCHWGGRESKALSEPCPKSLLSRRSKSAPDMTFVRDEPKLTVNYILSFLRNASNVANKSKLSIYIQFPDGSAAKPTVSRLQRASRWVSFWRIHMRGMQVLLWQKLQQPHNDTGMQKQPEVFHRQKEPHLMQGLSPP